MSPFARIAARRVATIQRPTIAVQASRPFSSTPRLQKSATETAKDGIKKVDRVVSDQIVKGLDAAESAKESVKGSAEKAAGDAQGKAKEMKGEAKGGAEELKGKAKGMAEEAEGKAKGAAEKAKSKL